MSTSTEYILPRRLKDLPRDAESTFHPNGASLEGMRF